MSNLLKYDEQYRIGYMVSTLVDKGSYGRYTISTNPPKYTYYVRLVDLNAEIMDYFKYNLDKFGYNYINEPYIYNKDDIYNSYVSYNKATYDGIVAMIENNINKNKDSNYYKGFLANIFDEDTKIVDGKIIITICDFFVRIHEQLITILNYFNIKCSISSEYMGFEFVNNYIHIDYSYYEDIINKINPLIIK